MARTLIRSGATAPQLEFHNSSHRFRAFVSGVGAGKTWAGVIELLRQPAGSVGAVIAPTFRMLKDTTMRTFDEIAGDKIVKEYSKSDLTMTLTDGKQILFRSADEPDKLRGPNLGWFWLDEAAMMDPQTWQIMIGRLRLDPGRAWATTTPRGKANWVYKIFVKDPALSPELAKDTHLVQCSTKTNTYLPDFFAESLQNRYTGAFLDQELEGSFVDFGQNLAYGEYKPKMNDAPDFPTDADCKQTWSEENYDRRAPLYVCCDFNVAIMSWPVLQIHGVQPCVLTEITTIGRATIAQQCLSLRTRYPDHAGPVLVYGDASGAASSAQTGLSFFDLIQRELQDHYTDLTIVVPRKNPRVTTRILNTNALLRGATPWKPLLISRHECPILVRDFEECMLDESGEDLEKIRTPTDDRYYLTHASDALGYFACLEVPLADRHDPPPTEAQEAAMKRQESQQAHFQGLANL